MPPPPCKKMTDSAMQEPHRSVPTPFLTKTHQIVENPAVDDVISWNEDGSTFVVWRPVEFARDLLPKYFKHNNFSSFVRQLNTYGFRKIVPDRWEFANDCFKKGDKQLLCDIQRRKLTVTPPNPVPMPIPVSIHVPIQVQPNRIRSPGNSWEEEQVLSSNSNISPRVTPSISCRAGVRTATTAELADENDRLRKENSNLNRELSQMKDMCDHIFMLMSNYAVNQQDGRLAQATAAVAAINKDNRERSLLDLMAMRTSSSDVSSSQEPHDMKKGKNCPMLFGVSLGLKRPSVSVDEDDDHVDVSADLPLRKVQKEPNAHFSASPYSLPHIPIDNLRKM